MAAVNNQKPGDNPGYVYLMSWGDGLYKIGRSRWPDVRLEHFLKEGRNATLIWSLKCVDQVTTERALHNRFRRLHIKLECFKLSIDDIDWLTQQTEDTICAD